MGEGVTVGVITVVGVLVGEGVTVGVSVLVGVGHGLARIVTARAKGSCTPSSMTTRFSIDVSWGKIGLGPDMPKVIVTVSADAMKPDQRTALWAALYMALPAVLVRVSGR